jgi:large subunit ribosomal protein L11
MEPGMPIPVVITVYGDRTFSFVTKTPPNSYFLMKEAGIKKGTTTPGKGTVGSISMDQIRKIAEVKLVDMNANNVEAAAAMLVGSARSMGLEVTGQ